MIFQIKDDLFDYSTKRIGKPTKLDLKNQKITLPLIHSIEKSNLKEVCITKHLGTDEKMIDLIIERAKEVEDAN